MRPLSARQEKFCLQILSGAEGAVAARFAGYSFRSSHVQASRLLANPRIQKRLRELREDVVERTCSDAVEMLAKLEAIYEKSMLYKEYGSAQRAVALQARIAGFERPPKLASQDLADGGDCEAALAENDK